MGCGDGDGEGDVDGEPRMDERMDGMPINSRASVPSVITVNKETDYN